MTLTANRLSTRQSLAKTSHPASHISTSGRPQSILVRWSRLFALQGWFLLVIYPISDRRPGAWVVLHKPNDGVKSWPDTIRSIWVYCGARKIFRCFIRRVGAMLHGFEGMNFYRVLACLRVRYCFGKVPWACFFKWLLRIDPFLLA